MTSRGGSPADPSHPRADQRGRWASADITDRVGTVLADSTTNTAFRDGAVYALNAQFDEVGAASPRPVFEIFRTPLRAEAP